MHHIDFNKLNNDVENLIWTSNIIINLTEEEKAKRLQLQNETIERKKEYNRQYMRKLRAGQII